MHFLCDIIVVLKLLIWTCAQAVFFKMRVAGVLHIFQFETRQGEDICTALQTHINDIMMKRYSKAKQSSNADRSLPQANFGPKYEQHVSSIQKSLEETKEKLADAEKTEQQLQYAMVGATSVVFDHNTLQSHFHTRFFNLLDHAET
jgi:hypothetical protein